MKVFIMKFTGRIFSRSSRETKTASSPPGESVIIKFNPDREKKLLEMGNWDRLEEGTLNLKVGSEIVEQLKTTVASWYEAPESIVPPNPSYVAHMRRGGYNYYKCIIYSSDKKYNAVLRIGAVNPMMDRVEIYSDIKLRTFFDAIDNDLLNVDVQDIGQY